jgi:apolipoprotein D and lipocalin family protein
MYSKLLVLLLLFCTLACSTSVEATKASKNIVVASNVDVSRYIGSWNAITSLPQFFTRACVAQTARYEILTKNSISVLNTCIKKNGKTTDIEGKAVVLDSPNNAILEVTFNNFFTKLFGVRGDYVIFKLDQDYRYALVGSRNLKSLWLLARETKISDSVYKEYISYAKEIGFDVDKLVDSKFN